MTVGPEVLAKIEDLLNTLGWRPRTTFPICLIDRRNKSQVGVFRAESLREAPVPNDILSYKGQEYLVKRRVVVLKVVEDFTPAEIDHVHVDMDPL